MSARRFCAGALVFGLCCLAPTSSLTAGVRSVESFPARGTWEAASALSHGPLVGAIGDRHARIWARADGLSPTTYQLAVEYGEIGDPVGTVSAVVTVRDEEDFTGTVEITGLSPATDYWFRILVDGVVQGGSEGSFTTLPAEGAPASFRFAIGSCNDHLEMPYPIFGAIAAQDLSFLLHVGDIIYADRPPPATTQEAFEDRYKDNFAESNWRDLMAQLPSFMIWDDHEIENDWSGGETGLYLEARPAFDEYVASHNPDPVLPGELYYEFGVGDVGFFVLDTRSHRDPGSGPTMLGSAQKNELESWLSASTARFKFVVSSVQWSLLSAKTDTWYGFQEERAEIFDFVRSQKIRGVVLLSGDRHWVGLFRLEDAAPIYLYELSSSPLAAALGTAPAPDSQTLFLDDSGRAFVTIGVDTTVRPATLDVRVLDENGGEIHSLLLTEDDIDPLFFDGFESGDTLGWSSSAPESP